MALLSRREALASGVATLTLLTTGCLGGLGNGLGNSGNPEVRLHNGDTAQHEAKVVATGDFGSRTESAVLGPDEDTLFENFIPRLDYDHQFTIIVTVDGDEVSTTEHTLQEWRQYLIEIEDSETVSVEGEVTR
ncbi:hypothetical protein HUG10_14310 [Halorarum halophilum]|uniref:Uncharacterized protein n=1 Tax=Halorarum halophilum TaxID=2743090 RepID=A0A7D5GD26_9EURY|nr:hypothetical protein [Halobaculum halophilum]QLG28645.1 hypothetical protein HUG10_14310 [Halobaculum halophilum]